MKDTAAQQLTDPEIESHCRDRNRFEFYFSKPVDTILIGLGGRIVLCSTLQIELHILLCLKRLTFYHSDAFEFGVHFGQNFYILID